MDMARLERLKLLIFNSDDRACFIERENILAQNRDAVAALPYSQRYTAEFELLMKHLSTPLEADDVFAGRMVEGASVQENDRVPPCDVRLWLNLYR